LPREEVLMTAESPFSSAATLQHLFWHSSQKGAEGLRPRLETQANNLGFFLLACSNYFQHHDALDDTLGRDEHQQFRQKLGQAFNDHQADLKKATATGSLPKDYREDDVEVFENLACIGFDGLQPARQRAEGPWKVVHNQIRSLRPRRAAAEDIRVLDVPLAGLNYNKVRDDERFWHDELEGIECDLLFNKFPFANYHTLIVPDIKRNLKQVMLRQYHDWIWRVLEAAGEIPGLAVGYNSLGAYASAKHFHFQLVMEDEEPPLPVADCRWKHKGGVTDYSADCERFCSPEESWEWIAERHREMRPATGEDGKVTLENVASYNLLYVPGEVYCFRRQLQGDCGPSAWTSGFAFYEMSGAMLTFNEDDYRSLRADMIKEEFRKVLC
jgi:hypothetical protein